VRTDCPVEQELLEAAAAGRWPDRADPGLQAHVADCPVCRDVAVLAVAFLEDRDAAWAEARVPAASLVWWRAQLRAREEAARLAGRPIVVAQTVAAVSVFLVSAALAPEAAAWLRGWIETFGVGDWRSIPDHLTLSWLLGTAAHMTLPVLAVGLWVVLAPLVVFLTLEDRGNP
jgi:hypothetical protein